MQSGDPFRLRAPAITAAKMFAKELCPAATTAILHRLALKDYSEISTSPEHDISLFLAMRTYDTNFVCSAMVTIKFMDAILSASLSP